MAYPPYDPQSVARRPSMSYGTPMYQPHQLPMDQAYPHPSYDIYANPHAVPMSRRMSSHSAYDDHGYYRAHQRLPSNYTPRPIVVSMPRQRRHSTVSFTTSGHNNMEAYLRPSSLRVKFKRKGAFMNGVSLVDAQSHNIRLSGNDSYHVRDMHPDRRDNIYLLIKWSGYQALQYEIPLESYSSRVNLQTLARRVARSCVHYFSTNRIPLAWDRLDLHHLEETSYGVWQPMLAVH
ncbi:uncharacterized protein BT62DRAFT_143124 [Guyanagaster necrorhizus]|uniref:DUF6741 domain-containing protein n=1 Tax=Guyanagaster necrorhizus TaxID=856835 RepID=A0A9P7VU40_9AGAR|nr:uncharacterized protein BT62DRAFT_143124 [Guyanagaster necrorhizus MCA 3950]KAG7445931.1 hypothetical protein BT62DRAFT_143124 [Guyanagaster necrorhizus MCA 3950]